MKKERTQKNNGTEKTSPSGLGTTDPIQQDRSVSQDSLKAFAGNSLNVADKPLKEHSQLRDTDKSIKNNSGHGMAEKPDVVSSLDQTLKQRVWKLLEKNHELKPLEICKLLELPRSKADSVGHRKTEWKHDFRNRLAPKCLKFHKARGWIHALKAMDREAAVGVGWLQSKAKNGMLVWSRDLLLGRLEWFRTGRINAWIRRPATKGKALELLAKAFCWTKLIPDMNVFAAWAATLRFKGSHLTLDVGEKVPYAMIDFLKESNGVIFRAGDISDPTKYELEFCYPDWAERNELLFTQITKFLQDLSAPRSPPINDWSVV